MLERLGEPLPAEVVAGDWWNEGRAVSGALRLANGARVDGAWIQLLDDVRVPRDDPFISPTRCTRSSSRRPG